MLAYHSQPTMAITVHGFVRGCPLSIKYEFVESLPNVLDQIESIINDLRSQGLVGSFDSPIEELFYFEWYARRRRIDLVYQHEVLGGKYRLDFAYLPAQIAIELDGYEWHSTREQFTRDRQRQRELERYGWRFIRFSGQEILENVAKCVDEVLLTIG